MTPSLAIIGTRGYPSYYGGFETAVRKLAPFLADRGWDVTVYGRRGATRPDDAARDPRVTAVATWGLESKSLSTLTHGLTATLHALIRKPDVVLVMNVANGFWLPLLRLRGIPSIVNVDGIEWERAKWGRLAKAVFKGGAKATARFADALVSDSVEIQRRWSAEFGRSSEFIPYGGDTVVDGDVPLQLTHRGYVLLVARFVPENTIEEFLEAVPAVAADYPVVMVGSSGYGGPFDDAAAGAAERFSNVRWLGHVSDDALLLALWAHAGAYVHGHSVGGTNPALVQAMAAGAPILARDTVFNREVLPPGTSFFQPRADQITSGISELMRSPEKQRRSSEANRQRAVLNYSWASVCAKYEAAIRELAGAPRSRGGVKRKFFARE